MSRQSGRGLAAGLELALLLVGAGGGLAGCGPGWRPEVAWPAAAVRTAPACPWPDRASQLRVSGWVDRREGDWLVVLGEGQRRRLVHRCWLRGGEAGEGDYLRAGEVVVGPTLVGQLEAVQRTRRLRERTR